MAQSGKHFAVACLIGCRVGSMWFLGATGMRGDKICPAFPKQIVWLCGYLKGKTTSSLATQT